MFFALLYIFAVYFKSTLRSWPTIVNVTQKQRRLTNYLTNWWTNKADSFSKNAEGPQIVDIESLTTEFKHDRAFRKLQLTSPGGLPDFEVLFNIVKSLAPSPTDEEATLIATALLRVDKGSKMLRKTTVLGAVLTVVALSIRNILRGR